MLKLPATIADYLEEEAWLRDMHKQGWKYVDMTLPCFYHFESCQPEDVIYRLDYKNKTETQDYINMTEDYGWEYVGSKVGWLCFRKPASQVVGEADGEIFSDSESRVEMVEHLVKTRIWPLTILFLCCVIPNFSNALSGRHGCFFTIIWAFLFITYVYLIIYCGIKLRRIRHSQLNR